MRRPSTGFDMHWNWGGWQELIRGWQAAREMPNLYIQRWHNGSVADFEIDPQHMEQRAKELAEG